MGSSSFRLAIPRSSSTSEEKTVRPVNVSYAIIIKAVDLVLCNYSLKWILRLSVGVPPHYGSENQITQAIPFVLQVLLPLL